MNTVSTVGVYQGSAHKSDGTINTGYIPNWRSFSNSEKNNFFSERNNQGVKLEGGKGNKAANDLDNLRELKKKKVQTEDKKH